MRNLEEGKREQAKKSLHPSSRVPFHENKMIQPEESKGSKFKEGGPMLKKVFSILLFTLTLAGAAGSAHAAVSEVSISSPVGEFRDGGEEESADRLIGNCSWFYLGILQGNRPRIFIASGTSRDYDPSHSTPTTAGFVGIWMNGIGDQVPQHHLDIWGRVRSTDSAYFATASGSVVVGSTTPYPGAKLTIEGSIYASSFIGQNSTSTTSIDLFVTTAGAATVTSTAAVLDIMGVTVFNFSTSAVITKIGAGGLDIGTEGTSQLYQFLAITDAAGSVVGCILSSQTVSPVLPAGYTKWRRLAWVYNDSSGNFVEFNKRGGFTDILKPIEMLNTNSPGTSGTVDLSAVVPRTARRVRIGWYQNVNDAKAKAVVWMVGSKSVASSDPQEYGFILDTLGSPAPHLQMNFDLPVIHELMMKYFCTSSTHLDVYVNGFEEDY